MPSLLHMHKRCLPSLVWFGGLWGVQVLEYRVERLDEDDPRIAAAAKDEANGGLLRSPPPSQPPPPPSPAPRHQPKPHTPKSSRYESRVSGRLVGCVVERTEHTKRRVSNTGR